EETKNDSGKLQHNQHMCLLENSVADVVKRSQNSLVQKEGINSASPTSPEVSLNLSPLEPLSTEPTTEPKLTAETKRLPAGLS
ncbi:hypothetical protein PSY31_23625, partial [Shigella flexneri]|nr:hypothetical protein [Shigella flexneri]